MSRPFVVTEYVRWGDIDLAGIIFYGAYLRFFEIAEEEIFRAAGLPMKDMFDRYDMWLPRKVMHTEFFVPAVLDERLEVVTYFSRIGTTSLTINFDVFGASRAPLHAVAHQVVVCVARGDMKKKPLPDGVVSALSPFRMSTEAARAREGPRPR